MTQKERDQFVVVLSDTSVSAQDCRIADTVSQYASVMFEIQYFI